MQPILSRLPAKGNDEFEVDIEVDIDIVDDNLEYLFASSGVEGIHSDSELSKSVLYTHSRLPSIDRASFHLWQSLHSFQCISTKYKQGFPCSGSSLSLIKKSFNWNQLSHLPLQDEHTWFAVAIQSKRKRDCGSLGLFEVNRLYHEEAIRSGGLLMFWLGQLDPITGLNFTTFIWQSYQDAIKAAKLPFHAKADSFAKKAYQTVQITRYSIKKLKGESRIRLELWKED